MTRLIRAARYVASLAVGMAHMVLALWAGSAAGGWAWRHGYTLPFDTGSSMSAAIVFGLVGAGAVLTLPEPWMTQVRCWVRGLPLFACEGCGCLISTDDLNENDVNTTPKELTP